MGIIARLRLGRQLVLKEKGFNYAAGHLLKGGSATELDNLQRPPYDAFDHGMDEAVRMATDKGWLIKDTDRRR